MLLSLTTNIRHGSIWGRRLVASVPGVVVCVFAGCDGQTGASQRQGAVAGTGSGAQRLAEQEYERQMDVSKRHQEETERQLQETARQLAESDRNLREAATQSKRYDELQERWNSQADRVDALLLRWEKLTEAMEQRLREKP